MRKRDVSSAAHDNAAAGSGGADGGASIEQKIWYGRIPVVFSLHPSEVTTLHAPRPFYVSFFPSACCFASCVCVTMEWVH